jgi:hypothetical protein
MDAVRKDTACEDVSTLLAKLGEEKKQETFLDLMQKTVTTQMPDDQKEFLTTALISAGANVGSAGPRIMALAIESGASEQVVRTLHDNGASFEEAIFLMQREDKPRETVKKAEIYREKITGVPASMTDPELIEEIKALRRELTGFQEAFAEAFPQLAEALQPRRIALDKKRTPELNA